jgi:hypothetical protein
MTLVPSEDPTASAESLPTGTTLADFYMGPYRISGLVPTANRRLIDVLREPTRQYLDLRRVRIEALVGSEPSAEYVDGLLTKADIDWVAVRAEPPRAEARLYGFVKKSPVRVALVLRTCRVEGNVHVESGSTDPIAFFLRGLEKGTDRFIAVTSAILTPHPSGSDGPLGLAIVNRTAVRMVNVIRA